jgi:hypothetical protein
MSEDFKSAEARQEMMRNIEAAKQLQAIKANTTAGKTMKVRNSDLAMRPTLHPGDVLTVGGANVMKLRSGDLVYFKVGGADEYRVRRVVRRVNEGSDVAFMVADDDGHEERVVDTQILGLVHSAERRGETISFQKSALNIDSGKVMEKGISLVQEAYNRISGLFNRKSGG